MPDDSIADLFISPMGERRRFELLDGIGVIVSERARSRFAEQQAPNRLPWDARSVPNIAGMIRDIQRSPGRTTFPARRFQSRPAGIDTGRLRDSIEHSVDLGENSVSVGSGLDYARDVQEGGERFIDADARVSAGLLRFANKPAGRQHRKALLSAVKEISNEGNYHIETPAREFLGFGRGEEAEILDLVMQTLWGVQP